MTRLENTPLKSSFVMLAPAGAVVPSAFRGLSRGAVDYQRLLTEMQIMRGAVALEEGAIHREDLDSQGRHYMPGDENSWHLLRVNEEGQVRGCARILVHPEGARFSSLRLAGAAVATCADWGRQVRFAVEAEMAVARMSGLMLVEPGGWVMDEKLRGSLDAVTIALSAFAWSQLVGGCLAYVTATVKHGSCTMLKRMGGSLLKFAGTVIPRYYDPAYGCEMELLKIDTNSLNPRFESTMAGLREVLACSPVYQSAGMCMSAGSIAA